MQQKVIKVGSSAGVTIPKHSLEMLGLSIGSSVTISIDQKNKRMVVESTDASLAGIDEETIAWTKTFVDQYRGALKELADK